MTLESTKVKAKYTGNGVTKSFPVPFAYSEADTIILLHTDAKGKSVPITSNYTIAVNGSGNTTVIYPVSGDPIEEGVTLTIYRNTPHTQVISFNDVGPFSPEELEVSGFDRTVMMIQELQEEVNRSIKVAITSNKTPDELLEEIFSKRDQAVQAAKDTQDALVATTSQVDIVIKTAEKSIHDIQDAISAVEKVVNVVKNIEGFANATQAFHGIMLDENMKLLWIKGEDGEPFNAKDFLFSAILPTEARFFLELGQLFVELPFTQ